MSCGSRDLLARSPSKCTVLQCGRRVRIGVHSIWKGTTARWCKQQLAPRPGDAGDAALSTGALFLWIIARGFKLSTNCLQEPDQPPTNK